MTLQNILYTLLGAIGCLLIFIRICAHRPFRWAVAALLCLAPGVSGLFVFAFRFRVSEIPPDGAVGVALLSLIFLVAGGVLGTVAIAESTSRAVRVMGVTTIAVSVIVLAFFAMDLGDRLAVGRFVLHPEIPSTPQTHPPAGGKSAPASAPKDAVASSAPAHSSSTLGKSLRALLQGKDPFPDAPPLVHKFEAQNFSFSAPPDWAEFDVKSMNPLACYGLRNWLLHASCVVIVESLPEKAMPALEVAADRSAAGLSQIGKAKMLARRKVEVDGVPGLRSEFEVDERLITERCVQYIFTNHGYCWQIFVTSPKARGDELSAAADRLLEHFSILDHARVGALAPELVASPAYTSPQGWSVDLSAEKQIRWERTWPELAHDFPAAEFGIMDPTGRYCFFALEHWLPEEDLPDDYFAEVMMNHYGFKPALALSRRECQQGPARGFEFEFPLKRNASEFHFQIRVLRQGRRAWLLATIRPPEQKEYAAAMTRALDAVRIDEKAPAPSPLLERERRSLGLMCNRAAILYDGASDLPKAYRWIAHAVQIYTAEPVVLTNFIDIASRAGRLRDAIDLVQSGKIAFAKPEAQAACAATLLFLAGDQLKAVAATEPLLRGGYRDDDLAYRYISALTALGKNAPALDAFEKYMVNKTAARQRRLLANLYFVSGRKKECLDTLRRALKDEPDPLTLLRLAQYLAEDRQHEEIVAAIQAYTAGQHPPTLELYRARADSEIALKHYADAKTTLEAALKLVPSDESTQDLLHQISGELGQGDNSQIKTPLTPVPIPAKLLTPPAADPAYLAGYNAYYSLCLRALEITPIETRFRLRTTEHFLLHVTDAQAVERCNTIRLSFHPRDESFYLNRLTVKNAAGETVGTGRVEDCYVLDAADDGLATDERTINIPVPGLKAGCTVEYEFTREEETGAGEPPFGRAILAKSYPVLRSAFCLKAPKNLLQAEASAHIEHRTEGEFEVWSLDRPEPLRIEPRMAPWHTFIPLVAYGDPTARWGALGKLYLSQIHERLAASPTVEATARQLTAKLKTDEEKITALAHHVQEELSYKGIEFGRRARVPSAVDEIVRHRYGDCKDHALLLYHLLRGAGVPAQLVLIHSGGDVAATLPSLDQFDHMIVYTPKAGRFLDCTQKASDFSGAPGGLGGYQALLLDDTQSRLVHLPESLPSQLSIQRQAEASGDNGIRLLETVEFTGELAASMRAYLRDAEPTHRRELLQQYLQDAAPTLELRTVDVEQLDAFEKPLRIKLEEIVPRKSRQLGGHLLVEIPSPWEATALAATPVEHRTTPFHVEGTLHIQSSTRLQLPAGWQYQAAPPIDARHEFYEGSSHATLEDAALRLETSVLIHEGTYPAAKYSDFVHEMNEGKSLLAPELLLDQAAH